MMKVFKHKSKIKWVTLKLAYGKWTAQWEKEKQKTSKIRIFNVAFLKNSQIYKK